MRNARGVLGDAAIVGERRNRFSVLELRRTQNQPLRLEDGDTAFGERWRRESFEARHGRAPFKSTEGEPASRLPLGLGTHLGHPSIRRGIWVPADLGIHRLFGRSLRHRKDGYVGAAFGFGIERNATIDFGEQGVVLADTDIVAGVPLGAALAHDNVAGHDRLRRQTA